MKRVARVEDIREWLDCEKALYYTGGDKRWLRDGIMWQRLIGPEDSKDLIFGVARLDPGQIHLLHHHEGASELYYVLEGSGRFTLDEEIINGTPRCRSTALLPCRSPSRDVSGWIDLHVLGSPCSRFLLAPLTERRRSLHVF